MRVLRRDGAGVEIEAGGARGWVSRGDSLGTAEHATTPGTTADPDGDEPPLRLRGDELDLYGGFHAELGRSINRAVNASWETVDDACAFAWLEFLRVQPNRHENWRGWLFRTAQREAWRLSALEWKERETQGAGGLASSRIPSIGTRSVWTSGLQEEWRSCRLSCSRSS